MAAALVEGAEDEDTFLEVTAVGWSSSAYLVSDCHTSAASFPYTTTEATST